MLPRMCLPCWKSCSRPPSKAAIFEDVLLIDAFTPEGTDERRLTFRLTYRHPEKTLKDKEVDKVHEALVTAVLGKLPVTRP